MNKGRECLRHIVLGLVDNKFVSTESLLIFAYGAVSEIIPALAGGTKKEESNDKVKQVYLEPRADSFLIPTGNYLPFELNSSTFMYSFLIND